MTILKIWKRASEVNCQTECYANADSLKNKNCGCKYKDYNEKFRHNPINRRDTIRSAVQAIEIPKSTLFRIWKKEKNKKEQVEYFVGYVTNDH